MFPEFILGTVTAYQYFFLAPATVIFGPIISVSAGVFIRMGIMDVFPAVLALSAGELTADVLWYWLGYRYGDGFVGRFGKYFGITRAQVERAKLLYHKYNDPIILFSKIVGGLTGFAPAMFFTAGLSRVPFRRYMLLNVIGQVFWTGGLVSLGYFLGNLFTNINSAFERMSSITLIVFVVIAIVGAGRFFQARFIEDAKKDPL